MEENNDKFKIGNVEFSRNDVKGIQPDNMIVNISSQGNPIFLGENKFKEFLEWLAKGDEQNSVE